MVKPVQAASAPDANYELTTPQDSGGKKPGTINLTKHSSAYHSTNAKLAEATDIGQYKTSDPKKYERMKNVYDKTSFEVLEDGSVKFKFKGNVSAVDFKEAYGIGDGALQKHLAARHEKDVNDGNTHIVEAVLYMDSGSKTQEDFDDETPMRFDGGYVTDAQDKMTVSFVRDAGRGSYLRYSDGLIDRQVKTFWGGHGPQAQYDGMSLRQDEVVQISGAYLK